jgi:hypothetical protein
MIRHFTKHVVGKMDGMIQRCIICGEIISDYTNAMWPDDQSPPKGFAAGEIYIRYGQPLIITSQISEEDEVVNCNQ